jgi:hypothetical protein
MKKLFVLLAISVLSFCFVTNVKAQTPTVNKNWSQVVIKDFSLATTVTSATIPFFPSENVQYLQVQADYEGISGDSCQLKIYVSANTDFLNATQINTLNNLKWKSGNGTNVTKFDKIDITGYPVNYIKVTVDTLTKITAGTVTVTLKPYFK